MRYRITNWINHLSKGDRRPRFFSKYEWWYHLFMMPLLFPVGNYYLVGPRYFFDPLVCAVGTGLVLVLYWLSIVALTGTIRAVIRRYPSPRQTVIRMLVMLTTVSGLTVILACLDVWIYSLVPITGVRLNWTALRPILLLGFIFDVFLCLVLGLVYTYSQWQKDLWEDEELQRDLIQHQYDSLKGQLKPHFLFNALNSLSVLIGEEPKRAEEFVDKLALVYRYMLQVTRPPVKQSLANRQTEERFDMGEAEADEDDEPDQLISLDEELTFIQSYYHLLKTRHGAGLELNIQVDSRYRQHRIPPLTLQLLVENAVKHNVILASRHLTIEILTTQTGCMLFRNNLQRKRIRSGLNRFASTQFGLVNIQAKYHLLGCPELDISAGPDYFSVTLPLLTKTQTDL